MRLPCNTIRKANRELTKFNLTPPDENNTSFFNVHHDRGPTTRPRADVSPCVVHPDSFGPSKYQSEPPSSPESGADDDKESFSRHFAAQKHLLRLQQATKVPRSGTCSRCSATVGPSPKTGSRIGIVRPRSLVCDQCVARAAQNEVVEGLLSLANPRGDAALPPRPVNIGRRTSPNRTENTITIAAVAGILRQCLKDLKNMDKQEGATKAVATYESTADRLLHCLRLRCLSASHTKLAVLSMSRCCKQWTMALKTINSLEPGEVNRQRQKAHQCRQEASAFLQSC